MNIVTDTTTASQTTGSGVTSNGAHDCLLAQDRRLSIVIMEFGCKDAALSFPFPSTLLLTNLGLQTERLDQDQRGLTNFRSCEAKPGDLNSSHQHYHHHIRSFLLSDPHSLQIYRDRKSHSNPVTLVPFVHH